ncbi:hypothetical protein CLAFUW4_14377 [Fulvia fulva]|uniref:Uncharacterized protein n=1 Tax=Passalora fulva TaxID=5499 RepID=A0A9Q8PM49_PASFU|nr:uncharacterized protein CLAFUR5_14208 [Fulvia fulva]KAK4609176.1 hypothetical protein CLAFUR4_14373 [Fulvia fulva]KAK4609956.1 hypothetical protein CLAFUR0_14378 [Fulvia fulva]UJO24907.1 hypothetical protein CLAFUR5_14208 [Fulvia fulva]WPV22887.1 hypothetical protein CLAFUW4_14377 [Fulvia fulva]WPV37532.1 hypothetical protein CLAFUW7_14382 [Fulvia fulva]
MIFSTKNNQGLTHPGLALQRCPAQGRCCFLTSLYSKINNLATHKCPDSYVPHDVYEADVVRIQRIMTYMLAADYGISTDIKLSKIDRFHIHGLHKSISDLAQSSPSRRRRNSELYPLAAYFMQSLHSTCTTLGICTEVIIAMIYRFVTYSTAQAKYKGCIPALARIEGLQAVAQKLYIDRVLLFHIASNASQQLLATFKAAAYKVGSLYFSRILHPSAGRRGLQDLWKDTACLEFEMSERGKLYRQRRFKATRSRCHLIALWVHEWQDAWRVRRGQAEVKVMGKQIVSVEKMLAMR